MNFNNSKRIKIMLDAGHYAKYNQSPVNYAYWESRMTWDLSLLLASELRTYGFEVGFTRDKQEVDLELTARGRKAKGYDLFLSLHSNAVWDNSKPASDAANIKNETVDRPVVYYAYDNQNDAKTLAKSLADAIRDIMDTSQPGQTATREGTGGEYYGVLRGARSVGCPLYYIIENSFHTNKKATEWLLNVRNLQLLAETIALTVAEYYGYSSSVYYGDIDGDGRVTARDYFMLKKAVFGVIELTDEQRAKADLNGDGVIDARDYFELKRRVLCGE